MGVIKYVGIKDLDIEKQTIVKTLAEKYSEKIDRKVKNFDMTLTVKEYEKTGKRTKYSVHTKVEAPKLVVAASAADWDLKKTSRMALEKVSKEIEHKMKHESMHDAPGMKKGLFIKGDLTE